MARKMKKFSAGGAQGRYERRMADIEKDYAKAMTRKTGKAAEVADAKRQQRIADAKDDLAKRTGADRTATRAAERLAESNLTKTRKYGAAQSVTKDTAGPTGKVTDTLGALTAPKSGLATPAKKPAAKKPAAKTPAKTPAKVEDKAADKPKDRYYVSPENRKAIDAMAKTIPSKLGYSIYPIGASKSYKDAASAVNYRVMGSASRPPAAKVEDKKGTGTSRLARAADPKDKSAAASRARLGAAASYLNPFSYIENRARALDPSEVNKAKGGKIMKKMAKGGSTSPKPMPIGGKHLMPTKKKPIKEPITGGANTVPLTPERKEFLKELAKRNAKPGMAKGGKATKFGKALVKKSADTKGRAMMKFAKGGSIDGCAVKGKTKAKRVTMKKGGSC